MQEIETEDTAIALMEFPSGAVGDLTVSTVDPAPLRIELVGERGRLEVLEDTLTFDVWEPDLPTYVAESAELYESPEVRRNPVPLRAGEGEHIDVHRDFLDAVVNKRAPRANGESSLASLELANAIVLSDSRGGTAVDLPIDREAYSLLLAARRAESSYRAT
jgi:predicted dehydrogenase